MGQKLSKIQIYRNFTAKVCYNLPYIYPMAYLPKRKNPSVTPFQNPSVGFQSKIKNKARSAALCAASLAMSIYANLIKSSGYYSPLNCRKNKTHDIPIIAMTLENPLKYMNQRCRKHFECGGVFQHFSQFFSNFIQWGVYCVIKFGAVTKFRWWKNQCCYKILFLVPTQAYKNAR